MRDSGFWENIFVVALILDLLDGLALDAVEGLREQLRRISYELWEQLPLRYIRTGADAIQGSKSFHEQAE